METDVLVLVVLVIGRVCVGLSCVVSKCVVVLRSAVDSMSVVDVADVADTVVVPHSVSILVACL